MDNQRLERALRSGPPFRTSYLAGPLPFDQTSASHSLGRRALAIVAVALLVAAALASIAMLAGSLPPSPPCPATFHEAEAVDTFQPGLSQGQRAWGIAGGKPERVGAGRIAAFAGAPGGRTLVVTIDPSTGGRCRLLTLIDDEVILRDITRLAWSPAGDALALGIENAPGADGSETGQLLIWTSNRLVRVWSGLGQDPHFDWAPDGRSIAVWTPYEGPATIIFADGSPDRVIDVAPTRLRWSPDGSRWIVAQDVDRLRGSAVSVVDLADGRLTPIDVGINYLWPEGWIDNERVLLYGVRQDRSVVGHLDVAVAAPGSYSLVPTPEAAVDAAFVLSPDGRHIAYIRGDEGDEGHGDLTIVGIAGNEPSSPLSIAPGMNVGAMGLAWSPDGSQVLFRTSDLGTWSAGDIWIVGADGSGLRTVATGNVWPHGDSWQPVPAR